MTTRRTPSQTIGPFFGFALPWPEGPHVVPPASPGAIRLRGRLLDGEGEPIPDGLIETWQADASGRFVEHGTDFRGFGRCATDKDGWYAIHTMKPGPVRGADGTLHAPHVVVAVFARGLLNHVLTRLYFADEPSANAADPVLAHAVPASRRATLMAAPEDGGYRFDIRMRGDDETVFFDV
jgi:protocatechuate 3,4-dioxygenase, alpha subunit